MTKRDARKWSKLLLVVSGLMAVCAGVGMMGVRASLAQSEAYVPAMTFDVASIRQSPPPGPSDWIVVKGGFAPHSSSLQVTNFDISNLIMMAYGLDAYYQLDGVPKWRAMWVVQAKGDDAADQRMAKLGKDEEKLEQQHMMQALLADRFHLKTHWETRQGPTYDLTATKNGPKMKAASGAPPSADDLKFWGDKPVPPIYQKGDSRVSFDFIAHGASMDDLTRTLSGQFGHPVTNKTGLAGKYDFMLHYHGIWEKDRSADDLDPVSPLDQALQDQLGLKVVPSTGPMQVLVIDHVELPSAN